MKYYWKKTPDPTITECLARAGDQELFTDIFVPVSGKHNGAAVILVHGGGWNAGERQAFLWHAHRPALHGYVAPMLLVHDPQDKIVPCSQSAILANALMENNRPMRFLPSPGSGRGFAYNPQNSWTQHVWPITVAWLDHHLLGATLASQFAEEVLELGPE